MSFKADPTNRGAFHSLMKKGKTPKDIAEAYGVTEFAVVACLKHNSPYIEGACYDDLELPIPEGKLREAFEGNKLVELSDELRVSMSLLKARLRDMGLVRGRGRPKKKPTPVEKKPTPVEKNPTASPVEKKPLLKEEKVILFYELLLQEIAKGEVAPESASKIAQLFKKLV